MYRAQLVWDVGSLSWVKMTQPGGGGGAGGPVTIADGADVAQGTTSDVAWTSGSGTVIALLKKIAGLSVSVSNFPATQAVTGTFFQTTQPVSGTFWQTTQPVSGSVSVSNFPATQTVSGTVSAAPSSTVGNAPTSASVGVASSTIIAANASRKGAAIINTSANTVSFATEANAAVLNSGITLPPYGVWIMDAYTFTKGAIQAIASSASSNVSVMEFQ